MSEEPGTEVKILAPSGHCLQTLQLPIQAPAAETMRTSLRAAGKEAKGIFVFTVGTTILEEEWPLEKLGITEGSSIEVTVLDSMRPCFEWAVYDASFGNEILDNGSTFQRGQVASHTDGVRTAVPLPRDTECYICFKGINTGTHASVGVGTSNCEVAERGYVHLYGQDENSWALCFGDSGEIVACHKGEVCVMQNSKGEQLEAPPRTNFPHMSHSHMSQPYAVHQLFDLSSWANEGNSRRISRGGGSLRNTHGSGCLRDGFNRLWQVTNIDFAHALPASHGPRTASSRKR